MQWTLHIPPIPYRLGYQQGMFIMGNFYPFLEMYDQQGWHHAAEVKFGDPFSLSSANYTVSISLPGAYQVITGSELVNRNSDDNGTETWFYKSTKARDFAFAAFLPGYGVVKSSLVPKLVILAKSYISVKSGERWRFSGVSRKIRPDLDEPNPKIMERGLATLLRSKALTILFYTA
jgi:hypothetical protein